MPAKVAIIGSGNIGTDLMMKIVQNSRLLELAVLVGIDPQSDGLTCARKLEVPATDKGVEGLLRTPCCNHIQIIFDATSANAHQRNNQVLSSRGKQLIDLTPGAIGP